MTGSIKNQIGRNYLTFSVLLILICSFGACSAPPPDTVERNFLPLFESVLKSDDKPMGIMDTLHQFRAASGCAELITVLFEGDAILFRDIEAVPGENTLIYTAGNKTLKLHRDLFVTTKSNGKFFYSLDGRQWYPTENNRKKDQINIRYHYPLNIDYDRQKSALEITFSWAADMSETARSVYMGKKEIVELKTGDIFYSTDKNRNTIDPVDSFLKISGGTEIALNFRFSGNLIESSEGENSFLITVIRDLYLYSSDKSDLKMGISFNGEQWNFNIFSFTYDLDAEFISLSQKKTIYNRDMEISYSGL